MVLITKARRCYGYHDHSDDGVDVGRNQAWIWSDGDDVSVQLMPQQPSVIAAVIWVVVVVDGVVVGGDVVVVDGDVVVAVVMMREQNYHYQHYHCHCYYCHGH